MSSRASAARYARALFDVALKESDAVHIERDLAAFAELMAGNAELHSALTNPAVAASAKQKIADALTARLNMAPPTRKLVALLADRDRLALIPDLLDVYRERLMQHQHVVRAEITTAAPLPPDRTAQLQRQLADITGRTVELTTRVDPTIIGGIVTRIGGTVYDGSIATQLARLKDTLAV
jgi:F-type H+-transporting ATPase subunit delta